MIWTLPDLSPTLRGHATAEAQQDIRSGAIITSKRAKPGSNALYHTLLLSALQSGTPEQMAQQISNVDILERNKDGSRHASAHETLAGGEYIRYYLRGLCLVAVSRGIEELEIYRAKISQNPRPDSETRIGQRISAVRLLADLRTNMGVDLALGVPNGPNSGLCAKIPDSR